MNKVNKNATLDENFRSVFLFLSIFPITSLLGLHTLFLDSVAPKIMHFSIGVTLIVLWVIAFMNFDCPAHSSCATTIGVVMIVPLAVISILVYIFSVVEALFIALKSN